jgi:hypothetical protein
MRICSLLPSTTEIAFALGLGDQVVGVTHECDYPPEAQEKPVVVRSGIDSHRLNSCEIDKQVGEMLQAGKSLYTIDDEAFRTAAPDVILTQALCDVCALDYNDVVKAAQCLPRKPTIVSLIPHCLTDVLMTSCGSAKPPAEQESRSPGSGFATTDRSGASTSGPIVVSSTSRVPRMVRSDLRRGPLGARNG